MQASHSCADLAMLRGSCSAMLASCVSMQPRSMKDCQGASPSIKNRRATCCSVWASHTGLTAGHPPCAHDALQPTKLPRAEISTWLPGNEISSCRTWRSQGRRVCCRLRAGMSGRWRKDAQEGVPGHRVDDLLQMSPLQRLAREKITEMEVSYSTCIIMSCHCQWPIEP